MTQPIRVLIADDHALVRGGFAAMLAADEGIAVVGQATDGPDAVRQALTTDPDIILLDIEMPGGDGLSAAQQLLSKAPRTKILILTTFDLDEYLYQALRLGVAGFLLKTADPTELTRAVKLCAAGESVMSPEITRRLAQNFIQRPPAGARPDRQSNIENLTPREREVLLAIAQGLSNLEIARQLYMSEATVKTHVNKVLAKLGVRDRVQAVILAYQTGLITPS